MSASHHHSLLSDDEQVRRFGLASESQWFERKGNRVSAVALANTLVAFANADGGTVVVGISDGRVDGLIPDGKPASKLLAAPLDLTSPPVTARHRFVRTEDDALSLLVFEVEPSSTVHENSRGEVFLRVGDSIRKLRFDERRELAFDKGQSHFDAETVSKTHQRHLELREDLLREWCQSQSFSGSPSRLLAARGLADGDGRLTNAAVLLFSEAPERCFPEGYVRVIKHSENSRGVGSSLNVIEDVRITGPLPHQIAEARQTVLKLVPRLDRLEKSGKFERVSIFPEFAWLELIVNAVVHRSYSIAGDHTRIHIHPERIEVESPGRLPGLLRIENLGTNLRFARNPHIARVLSEMKWGREHGEGIRRVRAEMATAGLPPPVFREGPANFSAELNADSVSRSLVESGIKFTAEFAAALRHEGSLSTGEAETLLRLSRPATVRRLRALEAVGVIRLVSKSKTDPTARWYLA